MKSDNQLRHFTNLVYWNIFRFECYAQSLVSGSIHFVAKVVGLGNTIERHTGTANWEKETLDGLNNPKQGWSKISAGKLISLHLMLLNMAVMNTVLALFQLDSANVWKYGLIVCGIVAFFLSYKVGPNDPKKYLRDFKRFELLPYSKKRKYAFLTFLGIASIWLWFVGSWVLYFRAIGI